ncbi:biosynthetic-type acetolactate synthase large subunit [Stomatobaculum longum]|uniref:biosynthetic-type acetolactate synthase large subunit n=1 Tax=Stomatobaculum longum TaxID=796942 RepID=UPI0028E5416D|nr:biosynthetic-type acetolactate synthase large subunit [Stomatobaculum longum]
MTKLSGAEIVIACLKEQGVDTVFGYPGGAILNIYDALYKHSDEIHHVLTSHEQGAAHAADGYARASGKVGVCLATSGPGATNLVTGIASAYMDSSPVVAITCNVANPILGKDSFQEIDIAGISMPITKYNFIVKDVKELAGVLRRAFRIARSGRPGPVLVDITKDVTAAETEYEPKSIAVASMQELPAAEKLTEAISLLRAAKKPCIMAGGGAILSEAAPALKRFAHKLDAPVCCTLMGQGAFDQNDRLYTGMVGMHGTKTSNYTVSDCDLLVVVGARFSDRVAGSPKQFAAKAKILQIDVDEAEVNKNIHVAAALIGDAGQILSCLAESLEQQHHREWLSEIQRRKEQFPLQVGEGLTGPRVIRELDALTPDDAIIVTEVGQHQMWAAQHYSYRSPRTYLTSGGLGTMGFGLGAAIGAQSAMPERVVVNVAGDGCFRMNMNELATVAREELPLIELIVNNHALGMVRQWQTLFYEKRYSSTVLRDHVDYCKIAEAMGIRAYCVTNVEELRAALSEAVASRKPAVLDVRIDSDEKVFPMCPPGADLKEVFDETDL